MTASEIVTRYLDAFTKADAEATRVLLADDFSFRGPMAQIEGADAFIAETAPLAAIVDGYNLLRIWEDGDDVCAVFSFKVRTPAGAGSVIMSEWLTIEDGLLVSSRFVLDTAAFAALMPPE